MTLNNKNLRNTLYWLSIALLTVLLIPIIKYLLSIGLFQSQTDLIALTLILIPLMLLIHHGIVSILLKASQRNTIKQKNAYFVASLCYAHLMGHEYTLSELMEDDDQTHSYRLNVTLSQDQTRYRVMFCIAALTHNKDLILSKDFMDNCQTEWEAMVAQPSTLEERKTLYRGEYQLMANIYKSNSSLFQMVLDATAHNQPTKIIKDILSKTSPIGTT